MQSVKRFFTKHPKYIDIIFYCVMPMLCTYSYDSFATTVTFKMFANTIQETFRTVKELMTMVSYACGIGFSIMGLFKLKAQRDNPAQIPLSTPFVLISVSAALLFLPTVFDIAGDAVFGPEATSGAKYLDRSYRIS